MANQENKNIKKTIEDLNIYEDGTYDIDFVDVYEEEGSLRVKARTPFGELKLGLGKDKKYLDKGGQPKWVREAKSKIKQKFGKVTPEGETTTTKKQVQTDHLGKTNLE